MSTKYGILHNMSIEKVTKEEADANARSVECVKCAVCGQYHNEYVRIYGLLGYAEATKGVLVGLECYAPWAYHTTRTKSAYVGNDTELTTYTTRQNKSGTNNTTKHRKPECTVELEGYSTMYGKGETACKKAIGLIDGYDVDPVFCSVYIRAMFVGSKKSGHGQTIALDCTVTMEGHLWFKSFQGLRKFLDNCTEEELQCFRSVKCGAHIHASTTNDPKAWMFAKLLKKIEDVGIEKRIELFGSDFRGYATDYVGGHGCSINVHTDYNTCEMRLTRIQNPDQFLKICKFWRACVACMNENYYSPTVDNKIARQFDILMYGTKFDKGN